MCATSNFQASFFYLCDQQSLATIDFFFFLDLMRINHKALFIKLRKNGIYETFEKRVPSLSLWNE